MLSKEVSTTWNVNPQEVRSVELIGYFSDRSRALSSEDGTAVAASDVKGRLNVGTFNCFDQSNLGGRQHTAIQRENRSHKFPAYPYGQSRTAS